MPRPGFGWFVGLAGYGLARDGSVHAGVDGELAAARQVRSAHDHLHPHAAVVGDDQGRRQRQLLDPRGADLVTGHDGELDESRARQDRRLVDRVVGQPRMRPPGQGGGQDDAVAVRQVDDGGQQGMAGRSQTGRADVRDRRRRLPEPVGLAGERVGRQRHGPRARAREQVPPGDRHAPHVKLGDVAQELLHAAVVAPQRPCRRRWGTDVLDGLPNPRDDDRVGADLDEHRVPVGQQRADGLVEPDGLAQVAVPVLRVEGGGVDQTTGHGGVHRDGAGLRRHRGQRVEEL